MVRLGFLADTVALIPSFSLQHVSVSSPHVLAVFFAVRLGFLVDPVVLITSFVVCFADQQEHAHDASHSRCFFYSASWFFRRPSRTSYHVLCSTSQFSYRLTRTPSRCVAFSLSFLFTILLVCRRVVIWLRHWHRCTNSSRSPFARSLMRFNRFGRNVSSAQPPVTYVCS